MKCLVRWNYRSSLGGPWVEGDVVDVDADVAEAIGRDSPGVLGPLPLPSPAAESEGERQEEAPPRDRMVRRKDRGGGGPITRAEFRAVKD